MGFLPLVEMTKYVWFFVIPTKRGRSDEESHKLASIIPGLT